MWASNCPNTVKIMSFLQSVVFFLCQISNASSYEHSCWNLLFSHWSTCVFFCQCHIDFYHYIPAIALEIWKGNPSSTAIFAQNCWPPWALLWFCINFMIAFSILFWRRSWEFSLGLYWICKMLLVRCSFSQY